MNVMTIPSLEERKEFLDAEALKDQFSEVLNRLSVQLVTRLSEAGLAQDSENVDELTARLQQLVARIGQLVAGLGIVPPECLPARGAGFGSVVTVKNTRTGEIQEYTLMVGSLLDLNTNQVSLGSPIGSALLGKLPGEETVVETPHDRMQLRVIRVRTLADMLRDLPE